MESVLSIGWKVHFPCIYNYSSKNATCTSDNIMKNRKEVEITNKEVTNEVKHRYGKTKSQ
jgi:hypothetical protein